MDTAGWPGQVLVVDVRVEMNLIDPESVSLWLPYGSVFPQSHCSYCKKADTRFERRFKRESGARNEILGFLKKSRLASTPF